MEKMRELLGKLGASKDLSNAVCEHLEQYAKDVKAKANQELHEKVKRAKQICVEEVAREKVNLARKVQIFLESKAKSIEHAMTKQRVAEDTEATATLKKAKAILEDIEVEGGASSRELLALKKKSERLEKVLGTIREERDRAVDKANHANEVAVKFLKKNQLMEGKLRNAGLLKETKGGASFCECGAPLDESMEKCSKCGKTVVTGKEKKEAEKVAKESKKKKGKTINEGRLRERLDASRRKSMKPRSTRRTLEESVARRTESTGTPEISKIALEMPED